MARGVPGVLSPTGKSVHTLLLFAGHAGAEAESPGIGFYETLLKSRILKAHLEGGGIDGCARHARPLGDHLGCPLKGSALAGIARDNSTLKS